MPSNQQQQNDLGESLRFLLAYDWSRGRGVVLMRLDSVVVWTFHQGSFRGERVGTPFPLLERITDGIANHFPAKNALHCRILHIQYQFIPGWYPGPHRSVPGAWTHTPISAWLTGRSHCSDFTKRPLPFTRNLQDPGFCSHPLDCRLPNMAPANCLCNQPVN